MNTYLEINKDLKIIENNNDDDNQDDNDKKKKTLKLFFEF